jgi:hypothetical protein
MRDEDKKARIITVTLEEFYIGGNMPKSLDDLLDELHTYRQKHKYKHTKLWLEPSTREDEYGHESFGGIYLKGQRMESEKERMDRVDKQLVREARIFEDQRMEFERLKNLFETKDSDESNT